MRHQTAWNALQDDLVKLKLAQKFTKFKRRVFKTRCRHSFQNNRMTNSYTKLLQETDSPEAEVSVQTPSSKNHTAGVRMRNLLIKTSPRSCKLPNKWWICKAVSFVNVMGAFCLILLSPQVFNIGSYHTVSIDTVQKWTSRLTFNTCHLPTMDPFSEEVMPFVKPVLTLRCHHEANPIGKKIFELVKGTRILRRISDDYDNCCYRPFFRENDQNERVHNECLKIKNTTTEIPIDYEFIEVFCSGSISFADGFAIVSKDKTKSALNTTKATLEADRLKQLKKLNVIVLGIDATSRMNFIRRMSKSRSYLMQNLSAVEMKGYTKVAENTLPNVVPLLTGLTLEQMKLKCISKSGWHVRIDSCPFIWHNFSADGYQTSFAEDDVDIGIFNMDWKFAFGKQPTDFYLRPFTTRMQKRQGSGYNQCMGTRLSFKVLLDNIENLAVTMHNHSPYFQLTWATRMSHEDMNKLTLGDDPLLESLVFLNENGYLNNTALLVMSDHGSRLDKGIRSTAQGKLEDRLPMFYIVMPPWFKTQYPSAWKNLNSNSEILTSPFDVHETFKDFMQLEQIDTRSLHISKPSSGDLHSIRRPTSLFQPLSPNRTCSDAGIPMHWCTCFKKTPLDLGSEDAKAAATFAVRHVNSMLSFQWHCASLSLSKITEAFEVHKEEIVWKGSKSNSKELDEVQVIHVAFETKPGNANFEATIIRVNKEWGVTEKPARINAYEGQSACVEQEYKPYCFCR